jgi:hypothetical protein
MLNPDSLHEPLLKIRQFSRDSIKFKNSSNGKASEKAKLELVNLLTDLLLSKKPVEKIKLKYRITTVPVG